MEQANSVVAGSPLQMCPVLLCSIGHIMKKDALLLGEISSLSMSRFIGRNDNEWIHSTGSGYLIRLNSVFHPLLVLKRLGLSKPARRLIATYINSAGIELIHFAAEFDVLQEFPVFDW
ncbi:DUF5983 family protein (plasmid) [Xenorhabdus stockiae]|uniref:DUF5983 family protein n=1 Tax=Xenorhabdus stockiae TaxID=351614 RepID=UPI003CE79719